MFESDKIYSFVIAHSLSNKECLIQSVAKKLHVVLGDEITFSLN